MDNQSDLNVDSLWLIAERDKSGKHSNVYHGNFVPQIPNQLIRRYTNSGDTVLDIFMGSGTTLFECETLNRNFIGFDINSRIIEYVQSKMDDNPAIAYSINNCDVTDRALFDNAMKVSLQRAGIEQVDLVIAHPPYMDIVKFTDCKNDLSSISDLNEFIAIFTVALGNALAYLKNYKYFAIVIGDVYKNSEVIPLGFYVIDSVKRNFRTKLKGIVVKNIEGNRGKLGAAGIWRYRALKSDYFLFKHEYVCVFKKEF